MLKKPVTAIVLAAGESRRMGRPKLLLPWGEMTVLDVILRVVNNCSAKSTLVVTGAYRAATERIAESAEIPTVYNPDFATGEMVSSLQVALPLLEADHAVLVVLGDLPLISVEMYAESALFMPSRYSGCGVELAEGLEAVVEYYDKMHEESAAIFSKLTAEDLSRKTKTPAGTEITLWKWLRAMVEHEIHHRGQLYTYLGILEVAVPPIYGLTAEEVAAKSVD